MNPLLIAILKFSSLCQLFISNINNLQIDLFDPLDGILTTTTSLGQNRSGTNANKKVIHTPQISRTGASPSDAV